MVETSFYPGAQILLCASASLYLPKQTNCHFYFVRNCFEISLLHRVLLRTVSSHVYRSKRNDARRTHSEKESNSRWIARICVRNAEQGKASFVHLIEVARASRAHFPPSGTCSSAPSQVAIFEAVHSLRSMACSFVVALQKNRAAVRPDR